MAAPVAHPWPMNITDLSRETAAQVPAAVSWTHFRLDRPSPSYWRVTFDHPPINTITATTSAELSQLVGLIESAP